MKFYFTRKKTFLNIFHILEERNLQLEKEEKGGCQVVEL
jgi:hypothetical protein